MSKPHLAMRCFMSRARQCQPAGGSRCGCGAGCAAGGTAADAQRRRQAQCPGPRGRCHPCGAFWTPNHRRASSCLAGVSHECSNSMSRCATHSVRDIARTATLWETSALHVCLRMSSRSVLPVLTETVVVRTIIDLWRRLHRTASRWLRKSSPRSAMPSGLNMAPWRISCLFCVHRR